MPPSNTPRGAQSFPMTTYIVYQTFPAHVLGTGLCIGHLWYLMIISVPDTVSPSLIPCHASDPHANLSIRNLTLNVPQAPETPKVTKAYPNVTVSASSINLPLAPPASPTPSSRPEQQKPSPVQGRACSLTTRNPPVMGPCKFICLLHPTNPGSGLGEVSEAKCKEALSGPSKGRPSRVGHASSPLGSGNCQLPGLPASPLCPQSFSPLPCSHITLPKSL